MDLVAAAVGTGEEAKTTAYMGDSDVCSAVGGGDGEGMWEEWHKKVDVDPLLIVHGITHI